MNLRWGVIGMVMGLFGCSSSIDKHHAQSEPSFQLMSFFTGKVIGYGMVQDRFGKQSRRFTVHLNGERDNNHLILYEIFYWNDGEEQTRTWQIEQQGDLSYIATADDVVGKAIGKERGNALYYAYLLKGVHLM